jgi:hypothetical protein
MAGNTDDVRRGSRRIAEALLSQVERISQLSAARMQELLSSYATVPRRELVPVVLANTRKLLEAIRDPGADCSQERSDHVASGVTRARQGITTDDMLHGLANRPRGRARRGPRGGQAARDRRRGAARIRRIVSAVGRCGDALIGVGVPRGGAGARARRVSQSGRPAGGAPASCHSRGAKRAVGKSVATVAKEVANVLRVPIVRVTRFESDGTAISCASFPFEEEVGDLFPVGRPWSLEGTNVVSRVRFSGRSARTNDYRGLPGRIAETVRSAGVRSAVGVPVGWMAGVGRGGRALAGPRAPAGGNRGADRGVHRARGHDDLQCERPGGGRAAGRGAGGAPPRRDAGRAGGLRRRSSPGWPRRLGYSWALRPHSCTTLTRTQRPR